jgi:WD40 repeat protein
LNSGWKYHNASLETIALSPSGRYVATGSLDQSIFIWTDTTRWNSTKVDIPRMLLFLSSVALFGASFSFSLPLFPHLSFGSFCSAFTISLVPSFALVVLFFSLLALHHSPL